jgi:hypothetical protein
MEQSSGARAPRRINRRAITIGLVVAALAIAVIFLVAASGGSGGGIY